jgi:hypothetical protein
MSNEILQHNLEKRNEKIQQAKAYWQRTKELFEQFGGNELKIVQSRIEDIGKSLDDNKEVRLVVLGEFSRGKSSLLNALLDIELLPTALEATTAINTFIRAKPDNLSKQLIRVHYQNGQTPQDLEFSEDSLKKWGTELNFENADVRKTLDYIEVFMEHPLLKNGLVLIDTPGLQAVMEHHKVITEKAISQAHIALWLQNATMLGGAKTEWTFLSDVLRNNFRKFITAVSWWDLVLDPKDPHELKKSPEERHNQSMAKVINNFKQNLQNEKELEILTHESNLMGVSAWWAMDKDPIKKAQSGIDKLSKRISEMFTTGEAYEQIYIGPLQKIYTIQEKLAASIKEEQAQLATDKTLADRQHEIESLDKDIQLLKQESESVSRDSRDEHERAANKQIKTLQSEMILPLAELKTDIESEVNDYYVENIIAKRIGKIGLPDELHDRFDKIFNTINNIWSEEKQNLSESLEGLRSNYAHQMEKYAHQMRNEMTNMDIEIPTLDVSINLDFTAIEQHHKQSQNLEQEIAERNSQIEDIEANISNNATNKSQIEIAKQSLLRAERLIKDLGSQPTPITASRREVVQKGGIYSNDTIGDVAYSDDTNVKIWREDYSNRLNEMNNKEAAVEKIIAEEERKSGIRMNLERAQKRYENEIAELEKKKILANQETEKQKSKMIHDITQKLIKNTAGQLQQRIKYLEEHVANAVNKIYMDQLHALQACVEEQFIEPMRAHQSQREKIMQLLQQDEATINQRKIILERGNKEIAELMLMTKDALNPN